MKKEDYLVAFIDILGFKNLVEDYFSGKDMASINKLTKALKEAEDFAIKYCKPYLKQFEVKFSFKQFSDCVTISMPFKQSQSQLAEYGIFFSVVRLYQLILLDNDILTRGGISLDRHIETPKIVVSKALINSYNLETQRAIYPRIIIDKHLLSLIEKELNNNPNEFDQFYKLYGRALIQDWDDEVFISPFGLLRELQEAVRLFGKDVFKEIFKAGAQAIKQDSPLPENFLDEFESDNKIDDKIVKEIFKKIGKSLEENILKWKPEITLKHKWLMEFMLWNVYPEKSSIRFKNYFSEKFDNYKK